MFFIVPDDPSSKDAPPNPAGSGVLLDAPIEPDEDEAPPSPGKVELDLDDAPFLTEDEPEPEPQPATEAEAPAELEEAPATKKRFDIKALLKNKRFLIGAGVGLILIIVALFFLLRSPAPAPAPQPPAENATAKEPLKPTEYYIKWEPFWVEFKDAQGNIKFLVCRFTGLTTNETLKAEADAKVVILRDQMYYYLMHKDKEFLGNTANANAVKLDILAVVNQYLSSGQLDQVLLEGYVIK